jgi:hypothetical protein
MSVALKKFNAGDYTEAAAAFESIPPDALTAPQKKIRVIRLLQSYENLGREDAAARLIEGEPVSDGLFYLLKSQAALRQNQLDNALDAAQQAIDTPTSLDGSLRKKATFQIASILHTRYFLKPNQKNLQSARDGWEAYLSGYCAGENDSRECSEANEKHASLDQ